MKKALVKSFTKKAYAFGLSLAMVVSCFSGFVAGTTTEDKVVAEAATTDYELVDHIQDASILHCWNWSYKTIENHMKLIAECGYSAIQTSPCQQPKDYTYEGEVGTNVGIPGLSSLLGNWWKAYQPVTFSVCDNGETWFGSKEDLESMCATAEKYGIKVIVDVVANHMGNISGWKNSLDDVSPQVGTYWNPDMLTDPTYWHINSGLYVHTNDGREAFTQGCMGMPDLNTGDSRVQKYVRDYLYELIDCGVDGFRFDAAKHIETPDDDASFASDFWPNVLNPAYSYYTQKTGGTLYVYGEILNTVGDNFSIDSYTKYMSVTDNNAGNKCFESVRNEQPAGVNMDYAANKSVIWVESHDTYMNESSRYGNDTAVVRAWAAVANKDETASLFFVRPYYSSQVLNNDTNNSYKSESELLSTLTQAQMGECPTYLWATNEVAAINHFNNRFVNCSDNSGTSDNFFFCQRGTGLILVNFNGAGQVSTSSHGLADGTYTDEVSGNTFTVSGGVVSGNITSEYGVAVIYQNVMPNPSSSRPVQISVSKTNNSVYYTNGLELTVTAKNATSASYKASTGETGTISGSKTITIGKGLSDGDTVTLTVTGTSSFGTVTNTYTYTKDTKAIEFTASKADGAKFYTDGFDLTIDALYADSASYTVSTGESGTISGSTTINIGSGVAIGGTVSVTIKGSNSKGSSSKTYTYTRAEGSDMVYFKCSAGWSNVYAYAWNDTVSPVVNNAAWPGTAMECIDSTNNIYALELDASAGYNYIIFNDGGSNKTGNLALGDLGMEYDQSSSSWVDYVEILPVPTISASLATGSSVSTATDVTFTVGNATSATYSLNGAAAKSFSGSVTLTIGNNASDTVTIAATNANGTNTQTFSYTYSETPSKTYVYLKNAAGWSDCYAYMWASSTVNNAAWPGVKMTLVAGTTDTYYYEYDSTKNFTSIIFNSGSNGTKTDDLKFAGAGYTYNNSTGTWTAPEVTKTGKVVVKYVDESGNEIATGSTISGTVGNSYTTSAATVSGYTLKTTPSNATGKYVEGTATVTYIYSKNVTTGWVQSGSVWYYYNAAGTAVTGWQKISSKWYYFNTSGVMQTGWQKISNKWYYFNASGAMQTGWQKISSKWYYFNGSGVMQSGWKQISSKWYYFKSGVMVTGWQKISGTYYYFNTSGVMQASTWVGNYYLTSTGAMAVSTWIGNYYVGADGAWVKNATK